MKFIRRNFFFGRVEEVMQVNSLNQRIGKVASSKLSKEIYFRTCGIFLFDNHNKLLVQKRSLSESPFPGYWDIAPGGVVRIKETDLEAIMREVFEEMGIRPIKVVKVDTVSIENEGWFWWNTYFKGTYKEDIKKNSEVLECFKMTLAEIQEKIQKGEKFTPGSLIGLNLVKKFFDT
jgi:isopentenyldiphosphate isomerase